MRYLLDRCVIGMRMGDVVASSPVSVVLGMHLLPFLAAWLKLAEGVDFAGSQ